MKWLGTCFDAIFFFFFFFFRNKKEKTDIACATSPACLLFKHARTGQCHYSRKRHSHIFIQSY
jgi:hypothetical protein